MLARRIQGASLDQIAQEFNASEQTVRRRIDYAQRHNLLADATDRVLNELVGPAHQVYAKALASEELQLALNAARDVLFGTGILSKNNKAQVAPAAETVEMTLEVWRAQRKQGYEAADASADQENLDGGAAGEPESLPGEILGEDDGGDDLPISRPPEWPPLPPAAELREDDEEDQ
jgi:transposase-like protein